MDHQGTLQPPLDVLIVGAGISGIGLAAHLRQDSPSRSFAIVERREAIGGTWDLFRYPGIRSDSDMYTLGYRFAPWRGDRTIASGDTIRDYLARVVDEHGLRSHIRLGQQVMAADWDSAAGLWSVTLRESDGAESVQRARFLFVGAGYYDHDEPHDAQIPGLADFQGSVVHPQFWPHDLDYSDKRVVVIGSGATAVTLVPAMADRAARVTMLQRTPSWYFNIPARDGLAGLLRKALPERWAYSLIRAKNVATQAWFFSRSRKAPEEMGEYLHRQLARDLGPDFDRAAFTPPYGPWEQRMCFVPDGDLFAALKSDKADLVTGGIDRVDKDGIVLSDGRRIDADVIVTATGLRLAVLGKMALSLDGEPVQPGEHFWYRDCMLSNVPNFAAVFGYLNAGWTLRVDIVADYLTRLLNQMAAWGMEVVTPHLPADHDLIEDPVLDLFSSGYLRRGKHLIPKSATSAPWRIRMDYLEDRRELRHAPIDDGVLAFERRRAVPELVEPVAVS